MRHNDSRVVWITGIDGEVRRDAVLVSTTLVPIPDVSHKKVSIYLC